MCNEGDELDGDPEVENLLSINPTFKQQNQLIENLRKALKKALRERNMYKIKLQTKVKHLDKVFEEDQLQCIQRGNARGQLWSENTLHYSKALKLYLAYGTKGYEEITHQNLPYPSIRTLRLRNLKFTAGILQDIFNLLKLKIATFNEKEKQCVLMLDEMALKPGIQFDTSTMVTVGRPTVKNTSGDFDEMATHRISIHDFWGWHSLKTNSGI